MKIKREGEEIKWKKKNQQTIIIKKNGLAFMIINIICLNYFIFKQHVVARVYYIKLNYYNTSKLTNKQKREKKYKVLFVCLFIIVAISFFFKN